MLACIVDAKIFLGAPPACTFSAEKRERHSLAADFSLICVVAVCGPKSQLEATDPVSDCMSFACCCGKPTTGNLVHLEQSFYVLTST